MDQSWKVFVDRRELGSAIRGAVAATVMMAMLALLVPSLHATLDEMIVVVVLCFSGVILAGAIHFLVVLLRVVLISDAAHRNQVRPNEKVNRHGGGNQPDR